MFKKKQQKIISVFYEENQRKILTEFDFEAVANGAMVETINGKKIKIDKIDKEKRQIYGFINNEKLIGYWWDEKGHLWDDLQTTIAMNNLAILNYAPLVKNKVKKDKCKK